MTRKTTATEEVPATGFELEARKNRIIKLGTTAFGAHWQTPLAEILTKAVKRPYSVAQVNHWKSGERPVPQVVMDHLREVSLHLAQVNRWRAEDLEAMFRPVYSASELKELFDNKERYEQLRAYLREHDLLKEGE